VVWPGGSVEFRKRGGPGPRWGGGLLPHGKGSNVMQ